MEISMLSIGKAILYAAALGVALGLLSSLISAFCLLLGDGLHKSRIPEVITVPVLKTVRIPHAGRNGKRFFSVLRFFLDIVFFLIFGVSEAIFIYGVGGILRVSYIVVTAAFCLCVRFTIGRLILGIADYLHLAIVLLFLYASLPIRIGLSFAIRFLFRGWELLSFRLYGRIAKRRARISDGRWKKDMLSAILTE